MIAVDGNLDVDKTVAELFKSFNEEIKKAISEKEKITSIAKLYKTINRYTRQPMGRLEPISSS